MSLLDENNIDYLKQALVRIDSLAMKGSNVIENIMNQIKNSENDYLNKLKLEFALDQVSEEHKGWRAVRVILLNLITEY